MVNTVNDCSVYVGTRSRDDNLLGTSVQVRLTGVLGTEYTSTFEYYVNTQVSPRQLRRITLGESFDFVAVYEQRVLTFFNLSVETTVYGVVLGQVCVNFCIAQVVDSNDLEFITAACFIQRTQNITADTAVAVDSDFDHDVSNTLSHSGQAAIGFSK